MSAFPMKSPISGKPLTLVSQGVCDVWLDPDGHGFAVTLSETYEHAQEDELERLWQLAKTAPAGERVSPLDGKPMVRVELPFDPDEAREGEAGDTADTGTVTVDVDVRNQFIWFDKGELEQLPADLPEPEPTAEENARVAEIMKQFNDGLDDAYEARDQRNFTEQLYRAATVNPSVKRFLETVTKPLA